ncbi:MAG: small basic protein [Planctomycetota bacterium]|nr:small basic protein [Planctomycetota bacterium]MDA1211114.1 small basic protein [Planctomycetota bacterium]
MTIDKSLKRKGRLARARSVLKRDERVAKMMSDDKWVSGQSPLGLQKTRIMKTVLGKKKKKAAAEGDDAAAAPAAKKADAGKKK